MLDLFADYFKSYGCISVHPGCRKFECYELEPSSWLVSYRTLARADDDDLALTL